MALGLSILLGIGIFLFIALIVWGLILYFKETDQIEDDTFIWNLSPYRSNGHGLGVIKEYDRKSDSGNWKVVFEPKDIKSTDVIKKRWKPQRVYYAPNKLLLLGKGPLSGYRNFAIGLPNKIEEIPEDLMKTEFGKVLAFITENKDFEKSLSDMLREGIKRRDKLAGEIGTGELSDVFIESVKKFFIEDMKETITRSGKDKSQISLGDHRPGQ